MLPAGYRQRTGSIADRPLLLHCLRRAYRELATPQTADPSAGVLDQTGQILETYLGSSSLLYWLEDAAEPSLASETRGLHPSLQRSTTAGLWAVPATDLRTGDRQWQVLLLYVDPRHRRRGLARHLLSQLETAIQQRGDRQISLQVFADNQPARRLYERQGFRLEVLQLVKHLEREPSPESLL